MFRVVRLDDTHPVFAVCRRKMPSLLEYLSYNCNFLGILAGPTCSYNEYTAFIEGTGYQHKHVESNGKENGKFKQSDPSPKVDAPLATCVSLVAVSLHLNVKTDCLFDVFM